MSTCAAVTSLLVGLAASAAGDPSVGWLNVKDCGASGSEFESTAEMTAGSKVVMLKEIGDFEVGQQVAISKCNPHICDGRVWGRMPSNVRWEERGKTMSDCFAEQVDARGYDGSLGNWTVYVLDFAGTNPPAFRWSDDLGLTWCKKPVPVTGDWQKLNGGVEVKFKKRDFWTKSAVVSFSGRDQLISTIMKIDGNAMTLAEATPVGAKGCIVQHTDSGPLQRAFDRAVVEGRNIFIPAGRYRLTQGLELKNGDGIRVEGENEETTIFDISNGTGTCISILGGTSVTIRNLRFRGFSGLAELKQMTCLRLPGFPSLYGMMIKKCNAISIYRQAERVLVENCHATGMSSECFYSQSPARWANKAPPKYTKSIVYRHCTVVDCARNAFNNNDCAENTMILYCRIEDVGGSTWEGASRFVKIVGNYIRNAGWLAMGHIATRRAAGDILPSGQHIVSHNTFEQGLTRGGPAIKSSAGATPVIISNNMFINFNTSAIAAYGFTHSFNLPSANTIITGNAIDLTCVRNNSRARFGIHVSADDTVVSNNQIYVRGEVDPHVKGIVLTEPARNIVVHDNIVRGCAVGLVADRTVGRVAEVVDAHTFKGSAGWGAIPWPRRRTHCYRGYRIAWRRRGNKEFALGPEIEIFDPDECVFRLTRDCDLKVGGRFALHSPQGFHWNIHHNVINNCTQLVNMDIFGGPTAVFTDNLLARGEVKDVKLGAEIRGLFKIADNQFAGFDEPESVALMLHPDPLGRKSRLICRDNVFDQCTTPIGEGAEGVWKAAIKGGNVFGAQAEASSRETGQVRVRTSAVEKPGGIAVFKAVRRTSPPVIDGKVDDWDWGKGAPIQTLTRTNGDLPSGDFTARGLATHDNQALYLALDISLPKGQEFNPQDGVEWSLRGADEKQVTPIYVLSCKADGSFDSLTAMGASADQAAKLKAGTGYAAAKSGKGWVCEWRVPWTALGVSATTPPKKWLMNIGVCSAGTWLVWVPTGGRICIVEDGGELHLLK